MLYTIHTRLRSSYKRTVSHLDETAVGSTYVRGFYHPVAYRSRGIAQMPWGETVVILSAGGLWYVAPFDDVEAVKHETSITESAS